ncbi:putative serine carboxypeptidase CPVL [Amblyomma americanum]
MELHAIWSFLILAAGVKPVLSNPNYSGPLFLTPLIEEHQYDHARTRSRVKLFKEKANVVAHSGYITVNKRTGSNLFFLYVRAHKESSNGPLMLWTQGGPGLSSLFGQFLQNGPLAIDAQGKLYKRYLTIQRSASVIYLDVPVGAGYSFTEKHSGYARCLEDVSESVAEFLRQFLLVFPEYNGRDFYVAGESYGARYAVAIAHMLLTKQTARIALNFRGTIAGSGFLGPIFEIADSAEFLYETSLVTYDDRYVFAARFETMRRLLAAGHADRALLLLLDTIFADTSKRTLFQNLTSCNNHASAAYSERPPHMVRYRHYVDTVRFREEIHVGRGIQFEPHTQIFVHSLASDYVRDISGMIELQLDKSRVLFYSGQLDSLFPSANQRSYLRTLNWARASEYREARRVVWKPYDGCNGMCGYVVRVRGFTEAVILGAGHYAAVDKPDEAYYLMTEFMHSEALKIED